MFTSSFSAGLLIIGVMSGLSNSKDAGKRYLALSFLERYKEDQAALIEIDLRIRIHARQADGLPRLLVELEKECDLLDWELTRVQLLESKKFLQCGKLSADDQLEIFRIKKKYPDLWAKPRKLTLSQTVEYSRAVQKYCDLSDERRILSAKRLKGQWTVEDGVEYTRLSDLIDIALKEADKILGR